MSPLEFLRNIYASDPLGKKLKKHSYQLNFHLSSGNWLKVCETYRTMAMITNNHPNFPLRSYYINGYTSILMQQCQGKATKEDLKYIKCIVNGDYSDALHVRIFTAYSRGVILYDLGDRDSTIRSYYKCLELCKDVTTDHASENVFTGRTLPTGFETVESVINIAKDVVIGNLVMLKVPTTLEEAITKKLYIAAFDSRTKTISTKSRTDLPPGFVCADPAVNYSKSRTMYHPLYDVSVEDRELISYRMSPAAGLQNNCAQCKAIASSACILKLCSCCKHVSYCGRDCQMIHWNAGHKKYCRKKGEFKLGDIVLVQYLENCPELNGMVGTLVGNTGERWLVRLHSGEIEKVVSIKPANLIFLKAK